MDVSTIGLDLAKNVFQVHGVDRDGRVVILRQVRRGKLLEFFAGFPHMATGERNILCVLFFVTAKEAP